MDLTAIGLILISALFHASWNGLVKRSPDQESFLWWMSLTSLLTLLPVFYITLPDWSLPLNALPFLIISGVAQSLYFLFLGKAYEYGDLSIVYPLARSSPLFVFLLAALFLNEETTAIGGVGLLLVLFGVYLIHLKRFSIQTIFEPLKSLQTRHSQMALITALCTTMYSLSDKVGVTIADPLQYAFWLDIFVTLCLTPIVFKIRSRTVITMTWRQENTRILFAGFLMRFGYILILITMTLTQVSYILGIRQISVVIGVLIGINFLREPYGKMRFLASLFIFVGVIVLGYAS
jgi:uncharacterized membrane protein